jgi:hypothetical protein
MSSLVWGGRGLWDGTCKLTMLRSDPHSSRRRIIRSDRYSPVTRNCRLFGSPYRPKVGSYNTAALDGRHDSSARRSSPAG